MITPNLEVPCPYQLPGDRVYPEGIAADPETGDVYLTDSLRARVYRVTPRQLARGGRAPLTAAFDLAGVLEPHPPGTVTLNGIVADPWGRYLLTVDMAGGDLYRIDLSTEDARRVGLSGSTPAAAPPGWIGVSPVRRCSSRQP